MSLNRIHRRHPHNPANLDAPGIKQRRRTGITVHLDQTPAGKFYYHSGDHVPASLPYRCAVVRKPYKGNSDRMKAG